MYTIYCNLYHIRHSDNLIWLWFLPMLWSMYTIYCNLYYIYSYTLTDSMSAKMYMEGKINYNYTTMKLSLMTNSRPSLLPAKFWTLFCTVHIHCILLISNTLYHIGFAKKEGRNSHNTSPSCWLFLLSATWSDKNKALLHQRSIITCILK